MEQPGTSQRELFFQKANTPKIIKFPANRSNKPQSEAARAAPPAAPHPAAGWKTAAQRGK